MTKRKLVNGLCNGIISVSIGLLSLPIYATSLSDYQLSGQANLEYRQFFNDGVLGQENNQPSIVVQPELYWQLEDGVSAVTFMPFYRYDNMDKERTHADLRELQFITAWDDYEYKIGFSKVFWGVTESAHLVDVINQTDAVEDVDGEDKLGQPMMQFTLLKDWGITDLFILPYFRERTFAGEDGRLRPALVINTDKVTYQSDQEQKHIDYAVRYSQMLGDWDIGLSYFNGTNRDPDLLYQGGELVPYYAQMEHVGVDVQGFIGDWLWKLEAIYRDSTNNYTAVISGFEYTLVGAFDTAIDLGLISEFLYDTRGEGSTAIGQRDIFAGIRFGFNNEDSTELLVGVTQDLDNTDVQMFKLEASSRLTNHVRLVVEAWSFDSDTIVDPLYSVRDDDFVELGLQYFF
ncbi:hypothetical protein R3X26_00730 [Vibrio sp. TH_r3]|uniref:hypothetical protein n=1 Tax=Vibrio sp. TH_r3 TaxID=3082084 RepID=UPI0029538D50|nr:hypothetical protein [Vibrio sp. TH_r3]MDV7102927.1 hypothetical protein [Vibrio sp. TH_r3]